MKKLLLMFIGLLLSSSLAWAGDPDLEGKISRLDVPKGIIVVQNELKNDIGLREYRVSLKQGMINDYKRGDGVKVWLRKDRREAKYIERVSR